jgi:hypothetical protein
MDTHMEQDVQERDTRRTYEAPTVIDYGNAAELTMEQSS